MKSIVKLSQEVADLTRRVITLESLVLELTSKGTSKEVVPTQSELVNMINLTLANDSLSESQRTFLQNCLKQSRITINQIKIVKDIVSRY
jgi:uncharacterized protein YbaP (TraB family)